MATRQYIAPGTVINGWIYQRDVEDKWKRRTIAALCPDCSNEYCLPLTDVRTGNTTRCYTCATKVRTERCRANGKNLRTHNLTNTPTYRSWRNMNGRCYDPTKDHYSEYGGRGITVCDRWRESFENFLDDMGVRPDGMTLDRYPDVNGNYEPGNCRWATPTEQIRNRRNTVLIEYSGKSQTIKAWADELGLEYPTLRARIVVQGWPIERALTEPINIVRK